MVEPVQIGDATLYCGDCREILPTLGKVDAVVTDPPYYRVKNEEWDRQWVDESDYLKWIASLCEEFRGLLSPSGSIYIFASPKMAARVEIKVSKHFSVLNHIVWNKAKGRFGVGGTGVDLSSLRCFWSANKEHVIFAEHYGADTIAKCDSGWAAKIGEIRGFVFLPLRQYLADEKNRAGFTTRQVAEAFQKKTGSKTVTGMAGHWFDASSTWQLPTAENYAWLRSLFGAGFLSRQYEDLRGQYEDLRGQYEDLRRPFSVNLECQWGDVWDFAPVKNHSNRHPCEKPLSMMAHIVRSSTRKGDVILDCFAGSGVTGEAAAKLGRKSILIEKDPRWFDVACRRMRRAIEQPDLFISAQKKKSEQKVLAL